MEKFKITLGFILSHPLGKMHLFRALFRLLHWQIQTRLQPSKLIVKPFLGGTKFYARKRLAGVAGNIYTGLHEFNDMAFLLHFLTPNDIFFDIGANIGSYTILSSGVCKAETISIEASTNTVIITHKNIALNKLQDKVRVINAAAGAEIGTLNFSKNEDVTNHVISTDEFQNDNVETINVIKVDDLSIQNKPALIKMDVEGFESEVLKGMGETLKQESLKAIIIELNGSGKRYGFADADIHKLLTTNGFKPFNYDPFKRDLSLLNTYGDHNTIYCRDINFINNRIKNAKAFKIMGEKI